ncbi:hypothetical protein BH11PSE14_BH11PSE14_02250 [soil metagenome]
MSLILIVLITFPSAWLARLPLAAGLAYFAYHLLLS